MKKGVLFLIALLLVTGTLWGALASIHPFGNVEKAPMDDYYIENAQQERNVNNIVTSVVFDYRAFDTIGEAAVLFTAVCSVLVVFRKGGHD
jgi:multisubunit Na+/H+ antiporter MnhB subunit